MPELFSRFFFSSYFHVSVTKRPTATPPRLLHHSHDPPGQRKPPKTCRDRTRTTAPCVASSCAASNRAGCQAWRESTTLDRHAASTRARCSLDATVAYHERHRHHRCAQRRLVDLLHDARADHERHRADTGADSLTTTRSSGTRMYRRQMTHQNVPAAMSRQSYAHFSPKYCSVLCCTVQLMPGIKKPSH